MVFARPNILRKIPPSAPAPASDYKTLLGSKLRMCFDVRVGGEFAGNGRWISHTDAVSGVRVVAPDLASRPLAYPDGARFRGKTVIGIAPGLKMVSERIQDLIPVGTLPEVFAVLHMFSMTGGVNLCGVASPSASTRSGGQLFVYDGANLGACAGGQVTGPFDDVATPRLVTAHQDPDLVNHILVDNVSKGTTVGDAVNQATTQAAVGGFATGFTGSADAYIAQWGIISPPMTAAERARFLEIARNDWQF